MEEDIVVKVEVDVGEVVEKESEGTKRESEGRKRESDLPEISHASNEVKLPLDVCTSSSSTNSHDSKPVIGKRIMILPEASRSSDGADDEESKRRQTGQRTPSDDEGEDGVGSSTGDSIKRRKGFSPSKDIPGSSSPSNRPSCSSTTNTVTSSSFSHPPSSHPSSSHPPFSHPSFSHPSSSHPSLFTSNSSLDHSSVSSLIANVPASPPRFVAIEEVMKAANGVANMYLAHEIAVDGGFNLKKETPVKRSLKTQIEEVMKKAFWDVLESQLNESPPKYKQALSLLVEIKEDLNSLLLPQHTRLKTEIDEILDIELIKQQAENGTLDFNRYAQYVLSVMARLCAPVRDEKIRQLTQTSDVVPLFRGIMELLELMKLDMTNFTIEQLRPHLQQQSVEYERTKFKEFLETQSRFTTGDDKLLFTSKWLDRNYKKLDLSEEPSLKSIVNKVLSSAYIELLIWDDSKQELYPETLLMDQNRFDSLREKVSLFTLLGSIFLIIFANIGSSLQQLDDFKQQLKTHLMLILEDKDVELETKLESCSLQVVKEVESCLKEHELPPVAETRMESIELQVKSLKERETKMESMKLQVKSLKERENRIRQIVQRRVLEFVEGVSLSNSASPVQIPAGLSILQQELSTLTGSFMRLIAHNRAVFGEYYHEIISRISRNDQSVSSS